MTTTRPARKAAPAAEVPAVEPAATEAPETPGAAEPDAAAPGYEQEGLPEDERPEPALDEAAPYDFTAHARRVLTTPWPPYADAPVVLTGEARAAWAQLAAEGGRDDDGLSALEAISAGHRDDEAIRARVFLPRESFSRRPVLAGG